MKPSQGSSKATVYIPRPCNKPCIGMSRYQLPRTNRIRPALKLLTTPAFRPSSSTPRNILEEDQHPNYDARKYYPARIGETVFERYSIISKLGWGANSTVWLAKDTARWLWQSNRYIALKITNCGEQEQKSAEEEIQISQRIAQIQTSSSHPGREYVRPVTESFKIQGPVGKHVCLVFEPLREPLWLLGRHLGCVGVPVMVLKAFLRLLLQGLDFLHSECRIIHTDLKSDNFLIGFEDSTVLENYAREQRSHPATYKMSNGHQIYQSESDFGPLKKGVGMIKISDFSAAVFGDVSILPNHNIQPLPFCAPEVLLETTWTYSADIWNLGNVLWELLAETTLFDGIDPRSNRYSREAHLAQMIGLLGPPPVQLLSRARRSVYSGLFSDQGKFKHQQLLPSKEFTFSNRTPFLQGEDKRLFLKFVRKMLHWEPQLRSTAGQLCNDPWLDFKPDTPDRGR